MNQRHDTTAVALYPVRTFFVVLAIVFAAETAVMFLLPVLFPRGVGGWTEALADACLLTVLSSPILWWVVIRPLRRMALSEQSRAASIVATAADGIWSFDEHGLVQSFNPAAERLFGYSAGEVVGQHVLKLLAEPPGRRRDVDPQDCLLTRHAVCEYLGIDGSRVIGHTREIAGRRKDGGVVPLALSVSEFRSGNRRLFTGIVRDLTERKRYEAEQRERELLRAKHMAAIAQMATGVAHEVRNPLTTVKLLIQGIRKAAGSGRLSAQDLDVIEQEIRRMERCLQTFLDYARPAKPDRRRLDLTVLVDRTRTLIQGRAAQQHVTVPFVHPPEPVEVDADWEQLQQLLLNLSLNALDMMPHGGELRFELSATAGSPAELRVLDSGPGIAPDLLARLFEPFVTTKETGVGLGLVLSRRIAEDHGGSLWAENRAEGGACFVLRLPVRTPHRPAETEPSGRAP
jgi:PAS domain S-box-containing protein